MNEDGITAETLQRIVHEVEQANKEKPGEGTRLFEQAMDRIKSARARALDESAD
ncbi:hypothetical protein K3555_11640 [Leisingera sp. M527]|uniref:hypothetical protein n=1 Tax=unclassified Leisingera TaxID=2614906 RepID=UPI0021A311F5|nr:MULTISPECIES: hypothetical protein [unclassified Leisingera]UWQ31046.1 hypothetical protein K3557_10610 [Leisingera sp. M523]UWQ35107.1 hypothetical protein K3555_11640 [Leisingera sp. M527]